MANRSAAPMPSSMPPPMVLPSGMIPIPSRQRYSASTITGNAAMFSLWSEGADVLIGSHVPPELKAMVNESRKFPPWLKDEKIQDENHALLPLKESLLRGLYSFEHTPMNSKFRESVLLILMFHQHQSQLMLERHPWPKEADFRVPIDALVSYIFRTCECSLTLPVSRLIELSTTTADLAVCINMRGFTASCPQHVRDELTAMDSSVASWCFDSLLVLHWMMEYRREATDQVIVYELETYSLNRPDHVASFFLFIRCVAKRAVDYREELAHKDKNLLPPFSPEYQTWKAPPRAPSDRDRKRKRGNDDTGSVGASVSGSEDAGGSGGPVEEDGECDAWRGELAQWCKKLSKALQGWVGVSP
ncbi:hypothetical protein BS47DRAFT_1342609 [Hydnum rufescens UP504]|uniref:Uncharacterized protein n=1 Tax=Hydnum rufescens UP504 TaxID=1448309 RepID=A0A9P6B0P7_9AGAM|nr:hypothetical protein BS47DRAFT_1342609 [Hydnum rufescens UP504]